jgi:diaminopimelate epimerase
MRYFCAVHVVLSQKKKQMQFYKYQGAGNDFVMVDQRQQQWLTRADTATIAWLCDRRFGIGGDGLILLQQSSGYAFEMVYFNADGRESTLCGNGGRCIVAFARDLGIVSTNCHFTAIDGAHDAVISATDTPRTVWVELKMGDISQVEQLPDAYVLNTGSPHYVRFVPDADALDMVAEGRAVRYNDRFKQEGINVNLARLHNTSQIDIRTYERGVEDETLACGTGVTAAVIAAHLERNLSPGSYDIPVKAKGGALSVRYRRTEDGGFTDIWLCGPAAMVFEGHVDVPGSGFIGNAG